MTTIERRVRALEPHNGPPIGDLALNDRICRTLAAERGVTVAELMADAGRLVGRTLAEGTP